MTIQNISLCVRHRPLFTASLILASWLMCVLILGVVSRAEETQLLDRAKKLTVGMPETQVIGIMGEPISVRRLEGIVFKRKPLDSTSIVGEYIFSAGLFRSYQIGGIYIDITSGKIIELSIRQDYSQWPWIYLIPIFIVMAVLEWALIRLWCQVKSKHVS